MLFVPVDVLESGGPVSKHRNPRLFVFPSRACFRIVRGRLVARSKRSEIQEIRFARIEGLIQNFDINTPYTVAVHNTRYEKHVADRKEFSLSSRNSKSRPFLPNSNHIVKHKIQDKREKQEPSTKSCLSIPKPPISLLKSAQRGKRQSRKEKRDLLANLRKK